MDNPFVYGETVTGKYFWNREHDIAKLKADLLNSQKVFLMSSRKIGKSSLVTMVLGQLKKQGIITVYLDLEKFSSYNRLLERYLNELMRYEGPIEKSLNFLKQFLPQLRPEIKLDEKGKPFFSFGFGRAPQNIESIDSEIYELPGKISEKKGKKIVVVFDEFQEILDFNGKHIEGVIRSAVQHQRKVGYVFCGSKKHLLADMVNSSDRPFYQIGPIMYLDKMQGETIWKFLQGKFISTNLKIDDESLKQIIEFSQGVPHYAQMLAHRLWDYGISKGKIEAGDAQEMLNELIRQSFEEFQSKWGNLIPSKKMLLKSIAVSGGRNILSKKYMIEHNLGYPSAIRKMLLSLMNEGILDRENGNYFFTDLLFCRWIKDYVE